MHREPPPAPAGPSPDRGPDRAPIGRGRTAPPSPGDPVGRATCPILIGFGLALLAIWAALYTADPLLYLWLIRHWVPEAMPAPFYDAAYLTAQLECWRQGIDVYATNPCETSHIHMVYPPAWLRLWFLPGGSAAATPFALILDTAFVLSLGLLPKLTRWREVGLMVAAIGSSATGYALERGNVDLAMFILAAVVALCLEGTVRTRLAGYAIATFLALLKIYPGVLLTLMVREKRRIAVPAIAASALVIAAAFVAWHGEWQAMMRNIPGPAWWSDGPGARKLPDGLVILLNIAATHLGLPDLDSILPRRVWIVLLSAPISIGALFAGLTLARRPGFRAAATAIGVRETSCLLIGGLLFCGCFMMGTSNAYREVFLLLAIPGLLAIGRAGAMSRGILAVPWIAAGLMWVSYPALLMDIGFGPLTPAGGPWPTWLFWLIREAGWWWLFIVLAAWLFVWAEREGVLRLGPAASPARAPAVL